MNIINDEMNIKDIDYTHYVKDKKTSTIKITKATNCSYPKKWIENNDAVDPTIKKHGAENIRPIVFWCDNNFKFTAYSIIAGSAVEEEVKHLPRGKSDPKPLADGKIVMFFNVGYYTAAFEDVTALDDPHSAIMARLQEKKAVVAVQRGPGPKYSLLDQPAPVFDPIMFDKNKVKLNLDDLEGKVWVMVSFASWCEPCQRLLASLSKVRKSSEAIWVAVNYDDQNKATKTTELAEGIFDYLLYDKNKDIATHYQITGLPHVLVINKEGIIRYRLFGTGNLDATMKEIASFVK